MSGKPKKRRVSWQQCVVMTVFLLIGGICGLMAVHVMDRIAPENNGTEIVVFLVLFAAVYAGLFVQTIVHEAGHLLFGLISGYKFSSFRIFSFMWVKEGERIRLRRLSVAGTSGQCLMTPPDLKEGKIPVVLYNLGGSCMNIAVSVVLLGIYFAMSEVRAWAIAFPVIAMIGIALAIVNGVPMRMGAVDNDGYNAFSLRKDPCAMRAFWVQLKINEQISRGVRLREMPAEWFDVPSDAEMKNSMTAVLGVFACNRLMDAGEFSEADSLMRRMLSGESGMNGNHRSMVICDRIYCEAIGENRGEAIEEMLTNKLKKFMKQMKNSSFVLRTEYVLALLHERNAEKAEKIRQRFEACAKRYPYSSEVQAERELMDLAREKALSE